MTIRKDNHPVPSPTPGPPARFNDPGTRRYRVEIIQRQQIDIDVTAGPVTG